MLLSLAIAIAIAIAIALAPAVRPDRAANATVQVLTPTRSTPTDWDKTPASRLREIIVGETEGQKIRLRLIDFE